MGSSFSAGPQAIGYLYQARHALCAIMLDERGEVSIKIEALDDVEKNTPDEITLEQLKHHIKKQAKLTVSSVDLWKTLRVWSEEFLKDSWNPTKTILHLITTAQIPVGSALIQLRYGNEGNVEEAHKALLEVLSSSESKSLHSAFDSFKKLNYNQQRSLIESVYIQDEAPSIAGIPDIIKKNKLKWVVRPEHVDSVYERLEGWWFEKVTQHLLNKSKAPITQIDVQEKVHAISEQFKSTSLPIDYDDIYPDDTFLSSQDNRLFVHQLNLIKVNSRRIKLCVSDFYRAFEQRSRWVREQLLIDDELIKYERKLIREWERYVAVLQDEFELKSDEELEAFGKELLKAIESLNIPIRNQMPLGHEYVMRGSYHILADFNPPHVYWHPKCVEKLEELISQTKI